VHSFFGGFKLFSDDLFAGRPAIHGLGFSERLECARLAVMTKFRPCIDLHAGRVKQIVGGSLSDDTDELETNFVSDQPAAHYARIYARDALSGGHVIQLGPGNEAAAREALAAYPEGLQVGGGINLANAAQWLEAGASHVIVTSYLFDPAGRFLFDRLEALVAAVGRSRLVLDLSCRAQESGWVVAMQRWQRATELLVTAQTVRELSGYCAEFLVHAADVEGRCGGIDADLVKFLGEECPIPVTYAGGAQSLEDLERVDRLSGGKVDLTIGSALDIFGGRAVRYADCVAWNRRGG
jgi:phosphoribosylformimino-5-aminoimidazole carboxamide ribotide isomerase